MNPRSAVVFRRDARGEYAYAEAAYAAAGARDRLTLGIRREGESIAAAGLGM